MMISSHSVLAPLSDNSSQKSNNSYSVNNKAVKTGLNEKKLSWLVEHKSQIDKALNIIFFLGMIIAISGAIAVPVLGFLSAPICAVIILGGGMEAFSLMARAIISEKINCK